MPEKDSCDRHCGFLDIDEMDKRKKFQRRYFVLDKPSGLIKWYKDKPSDKAGEVIQPCGHINIGYITKVDIVTKLKLDYCFVINTPFRPYYAQASNQTELEEWVELLNDASKITVPPEALLPQTPSACPEPDPSDTSSQCGDDRFTYRTDVVAGVVMKKKIAQDGTVQKTGAEIEVPSPSVNSTSSQQFVFPTTPPSHPAPTGDPTAGKDVLKWGWVVKQGHVRKNWKRRFFVLEKERFSYYKSDKDEEALRTVQMCDVLAVREDETHQRDNLLFVVTTDKIFFVQAESPSEMRSWIEHINEAIKLCRRDGSQKKVATVAKSSSFRDRFRFRLQR